MTDAHDNNPDATTSDLTERLVAYLDGELDEAETQDVEETLTNDPLARARVEELMSTWDFLDHLPRVAATEDFTDRTLTAVQAVQTQSASTQQTNARSPTVKQALTLSGWLGGAALLAAFCFLMTNQWLPSEYDELVEELPLIENLHLYTEVEDVEYLETLQASGLFDEQTDEQSD